MKQVVTLALTIALCLTCCACAGNIADTDVAQEIRVTYLEASAPSITASVTANYGDYIFPCTLRYEGQGDSGTVLVLAPETIAGLSVQVTDGGASLVYDGAVWDTGPLTEDGLSPVSAIPTALFQWREGFISESISESLDGVDCVAMTTDLSENVHLKTWFNAETHLPLRSEYFQDGNCVLSLDFQEVTLS